MEMPLLVRRAGTWFGAPATRQSAAVAVGILAVIFPASLAAVFAPVCIVRVLGGLGLIASAYIFLSLLAPLPRPLLRFERMEITERRLRHFLQDTRDIEQSIQDLSAERGGFGDFELELVVAGIPDQVRAWTRDVEDFLAVRLPHLRSYFRPSKEEVPTDVLALLTYLAVRRAELGRVIDRL